MAPAYDYVVAGGSFAGLVLATHLRGRVALIEKGEVGEGQTSACATTLDVVRKLGLEDAIEEVHEEGVVHTRGAVHRFPLPYPFCSFDYRRFCRLLAERIDGDVVRAAAVGVAGDVVLTDSGAGVSGGAVIDCTGWRAALARGVDPSFPVTVRRTYGLEKPAIGFADRGLHFYFEPRVRGDGYGWAFPAGERTRAGVLSYVAADGVRDSTETFLAAENMHGGHYHGGWLTAGLRPPFAGDVFTLGDSAGHCLPLTGEGIRPAVFFAQHLAGLLNAERDGGQGRDETRARYAALHWSFARRYEWLRRAQRLLRGWPDPPLGWFFRAFRRQGRVYDSVSRRYWELAAPILPAPQLYGVHAAGVEVPA